MLLMGAGACEEEAPVILKARPDTGIVTLSFDDSEDGKSEIYPLVGRWYPVTEVKRLSNRRLTANEWCARPVERITIEIEKARVQCQTGTEYVISIAEVRTSSIPSSYVVNLRSAKDAKFKRLVFENVQGIGAKIRGTPCYPNESIVYQRFPEYEVFRRKIIEGRPCSMVTGVDP